MHKTYMISSVTFISIVVTIMFIMVAAVNKSIQNLEGNFENHTLFENGEPTDGFPDLMSCSMAITAIKLRGTSNNHICVKDEI